MKISTGLTALLLPFFCLLFSGCQKTALLDAKPQSNLVVPEKLNELQALLDNDGIINETPAIGELSADNYYMTLVYLQAQAPRFMGGYTWMPDSWQGQANNPEWNRPYQQVFYANAVLEGLQKITPTMQVQTAYNNLKGSAHFIRAYAYYHLTQVFSPLFDSATAVTDLGLPLKQMADINEKITRASVSQTYNQILSDLQIAKDLLPLLPHAGLRNRPSQVAVYALKARLYLSVRAYQQAMNCADSALQLYNALINYNTVSTTAAIPFTNINAETIYQSRITGQISLLSGSSAMIDTFLYRSYVANDLRKTIFFNTLSSGAAYIKGGYNGTVFAFTGLATDELYLIRAECNARLGFVSAAMNDLNTLLLNRWKTGTYIAITASTSSDALGKILIERRKELLFRGTRFSDLRRLNKEGFNIILTRILNGQTYTLQPNSNLYTLPIPPDEIALTGIEQNPR